MKCHATFKRVFQLSGRCIHTGAILVYVYSLYRLARIFILGGGTVEIGSPITIVLVVVIFFLLFLFLLLLLLLLLPLLLLLLLTISIAYSYRTTIT